MPRGYALTPHGIGGDILPGLARWRYRQGIRSLSAVLSSAFLTAISLAPIPATIRDCGRDLTLQPNWLPPFNGNAVSLCHVFSSLW